MVLKTFKRILDLGYLTQNYINNVKAAGTAINPKLQFIIQDNSTNYYVDKNAKGNGSGSSWTNAATSLAGLNWTSIGAQPYDTIYVSGGSDSVSYTQQAIDGKNPAYEVVVTRGWEAGRNGVPIISATSGTSPVAYSMYVNNSSHIKFVNMSFKWELHGVLSSSYGNWLVYLRASSNITLDDCHVESNGQAMGVVLSNASFITLTDNLIETLDNDTTMEQDGIRISGGQGGLTITGNHVILRGTDGVKHKDLIQGADFMGNVANYQTVIANNFLYYDADAIDAPGACGTIYFTQMGTNRMLIYNNLIVVRATSAGCNGISLYLTDTTKYHLSARIFNNTEIINSWAWGIQVGNMDTCIIKNNIVVSTNSVNASLYFVERGLAGSHYLDIDYNHYYKYGNSNLVYHDRAYHNMSSWQSEGYDTHGSNAAITFVNKFGGNILDARSNESNVGEDLSSYFTTDILGQARTQWMGAIEQ